MQLIPYRNTEGYLMRGFAIFRRDEPCKNIELGYAAKYVFCPERNGLIWIGHCEGCEHFAGHVENKGVNCKSRKPYAPPEYYEKLEKPHPREHNKKIAGRKTNRSKTTKKRKQNEN